MYRVSRKSDELKEDILLTPSIEKCKQMIANLTKEFITVEAGTKWLETCYIDSELLLQSVDRKDGFYLLKEGDDVTILKRETEKMTEKGYLFNTSVDQYKIIFITKYYIRRISDDVIDLPKNVEQVETVRIREPLPAIRNAQHLQSTLIDQFKKELHDKVSLRKND